MKEEIEIVFLLPHRHDGIDYKKGDTTKVSAEWADKLAFNGIAQLNPVKKEGTA